MILVIGLATTKLLQSDIPLDDRSQPWLVDVAAELLSMDGETTDLIKRTVRLPKDTSVQVGAQDVHKISTRTARRTGMSQRSAVYVLLEMMHEARYAISFSAMTKQVIASVITRIAPNDPEWLAGWHRPGVEWVDLRTPATQICKLPYDPPNSLGGYRWPSRAEAAEKILGVAYYLSSDGEAAQSSAAYQNMLTDKALFLAMRSRGLIEAGEPSHEVAA